jgi:hypothetical protein
VSPVGQTVAQAPAAHTSAAGQAFPQLPQFFGSLWVLVQTPAQLCSPVGQEETHLPAWHAWSRPQAWPQLPQSAASVWRLTQLPLQVVSPVGQMGTQLPAAQNPGQNKPQPPQLLGSVCVETQKQAPLAPQLVSPLGQLQPQSPPTHCCPAPQARPHLPQSN